METFAKAQRSALTNVTVPIPGGTAGHTVSPMSVAGCYAPGGRYPLPSSVIMTAVTARAAGVSKVSEGCWGHGMIHIYVRSHN